MFLRMWLRQLRFKIIFMWLHLNNVVVAAERRGEPILLSPQGKHVKKVFYNLI